MKAKKQTFIITLPTMFGMGIIRKQGISFQDAFKKLCRTDRNKAIMIEDENGESMSIDELLGLELND